MIGRRRFLAGGVALAVTGPAALAAEPMPPIPDGERLAFDVIREGSQIGTHILRFQRHGASLIVSIAVDLQIGIGPITFFRYTHRAVETWNAGDFMSLDATTDHNGSHFHVSARRTPDGIWIEGSKGRYLAPPRTLAGTHWNRRMLDGPFLNTETGALVRPKIASLGVDAVPTMSGKAIAAHHFALTGDVVLDTWYDDAPRWVGIGFKGQDGSSIRYELADA